SPVAAPVAGGDDVCGVHAAIAKSAIYARDAPFIVISLSVRFLQVPVVLAWGIADISLDRVSHYAALNTYSRPSFPSISRAECSILTRVKSYCKLFQSAVGECQRITVDSDRYIIFGWTVWPRRPFCQHSLSSVNAIECMLSTHSSASCNRKIEPQSRC